MQSGLQSPGQIIFQFTIVIVGFTLKVPAVIPRVEGFCDAAFVVAPKQPQEFQLSKRENQNFSQPKVKKEIESTVMNLKPRFRRMLLQLLKFFWPENTLAPDGRNLESDLLTSKK